MMLHAKHFSRKILDRFSCLPSSSRIWKVERLYSDAPGKDKNLYRILGVSPSATQTEIKDAYYNLTLKFHPDRNEGSAEAAIKFHEITEAYDVLGNYFLRKRYDKGMPLPVRHEVPVVDVSVPHVVKYQQFFDRRNLPFQPSVYTPGGGARTFDEYHAKQFSERRRAEHESEEKEFARLCSERKSPTIFALFFLLCLGNLIRDDLQELVGFRPGPPDTVEHYEQFT